MIVFFPNVVEISEEPKFIGVFPKELDDHSISISKSGSMERWFKLG